MALTRKYLSALGIDAEKVDEIIAAHSETVESLKEQRDSYKTDAEKLAAVTNERDNLKAELKKASESSDEKYNALKAELDKAKADNEVLQNEYDKAKSNNEALKNEFDSYKAEQDAKAVKSAKELALKELLADMNMSEKGSKQVLKWMGVTNIELDENGKIKDANNLRNSIKDDWGEYIQKEGVSGAEISNPPANNGAKMTKEEILKIKDRSERQKAISENHELFGY